MKRISKLLLLLFGANVNFVMPSKCFALSDGPSNAKVPSPGRTQSRVVECSSGKPVIIRVPIGRVTVLSFPLKPKEILPGAGAFDFKQIKNDLAIKAIKYPATTNMFTYLEARRCSFVIEAVAIHGDDLVTIQDAKNDLIEIKL